MNNTIQYFKKSCKKIEFIRWIDENRKKRRNYLVREMNGCELKETAILAVEYRLVNCVRYKYVMQVSDSPHLRISCSITPEQGKMSEKKIVWKTRSSIGKPLFESSGRRGIFFPMKSLSLRLWSNVRLLILTRNYILS